MAAAVNADAMREEDFRLTLDGDVVVVVEQPLHTSMLHAKLECAEFIRVELILNVLHSHSVLHIELKLEAWWPS